MKYYAVTEDPNELLHYGVKGMKWGQHIFGDKPKSAGYHRALGKLRAAVQKSSTQRSISRQQKQQEKYNRAVQKAQFRINAIENMSAANRLTNYEKRLNQQYKEERKNEKAAMKLEKQYAANDRKMNKYMQQARQGKLHYGKLSEDQVKQITDRLALERSARSLGSAEKTWHQQKKEAFRKGKLSGIEKGTAAAMEEVARAGTVYGIKNFMNRKKLNAAAKQQGKQEHIKNTERNKKTNKEIRDEVKQEAYESVIRSGEKWFNRPIGRHLSVKNAANIIRDNENKEHERIRARTVQDKLSNERDEAFAKLLSDNGYRNEKEAVESTRKKLTSQLHSAERRYGKNSSQARAAQKNLDNFGKAENGSEEQKKLMISNEERLKETKDKANKQAAIVAYNKIYAAKQQNETIKRSNEQKMDAYYKMLDSWRKSNPNTRGPKPRKPHLDSFVIVPTPTAEAIKLFNEMGLPSIYGGGGGGKKK